MHAQIGDVFNQLRLARQRVCYQPLDKGISCQLDEGETLSETLAQLLAVLEALDARIGMSACALEAPIVHCCVAIHVGTSCQLSLSTCFHSCSTGPMLESDGEHFNRRWGFLSRAGLNDKSQLMRQVEKYADIYTSRVSNFLRYSPFMYFRSPSQSLAHDRCETAFFCVYFACISVYLSVPHCPSGT